MIVNIFKWLFVFDILRGIIIVGMIFVNNFGLWGYVYILLEYVVFNGLIFIDFVFFFFMFIMGIFIYIFLWKYNFIYFYVILWKIVKCIVVIFCIGLFLNFLVKLVFIYYLNFEELCYLGVM